jgi:hypothetical protein
MPRVLTAPPKPALTNWFPTLTEALNSEGIAHMWDLRPIAYGQTLTMTFDDGTKHGHFISIYRDDRGMYERPIHYARG